MGVCCTKQKNSNQDVKRQSTKMMTNVLTKQEQLLFKEQKNSLLKFHVKISNIKAKNLPVTSSYVMIIFANGKNKVKTNIIRDTRNPHVMKIIQILNSIISDTIFMILKIAQNIKQWKINEEFDFMCEAEQLKSLSFDMFVQDDTGHMISKIKLTLYQIATGPVHNDFLLETEDQTRKGRITFDVRMAQLVNMNISCKNLVCIMEENLIDKAYNFNLKVKSHNNDYASDHSTNFYNPTYAFSNKYHTEDDKQQNIKNNEEMETHEDENFNVSETQEFTTRKAVPNSKQTKKKNKDKKNTGKFDLIKPRDSLGRDASIKAGLQNADSNGKIKGVRSTIIKSTFSNVVAQPSFKKDQGNNGSDNDVIKLYKDTNYFTHEQLQNHKEAYWNYVDVHDDNTPSIDFEILADEFSYSSFELALWIVLNPELECEEQNGKSVGLHATPSFKKTAFNTKGTLIVQKDNKEVYVDYKILGNGYVSMIRFLSEDVGIKIERDQLVISETNMTDMKIYYSGRQIGTWNGEFIVTNQPFIRQLVGGVRTENGVTKATQLYIQKEQLTSQSQLPRELKNIMQCKLQIEEYIIKIFDKTITLRERYKINDEIKLQLKKIIQYLHIHSSAESPNLYKNEEELIRAQSILIDVAKHLLEYSDQVDEILREVYYETLILINNREELDLSYMGFDKDQTELYQKIIQIDDTKNIESDNTQSIHVKKIRMCLTYENFLFQTLEKVLIKIDQKGFNYRERQFVENFCALAFFRIPKFKEKLMSCLVNVDKNKKEFLIIDQWIEEQHSLQQFQTDKKNKYFLSLFEWEKDFYRYLTKQTRHHDHEDQLNKTLENKNWQQRFTKKGLAFFLFIGEWVSYVKKLPSNLSVIPWSIVPGYTNILQAFLYEIRKRETKSFPDALKTASISLLQHDEIINVYLKIIYTKTNMYDSTNVFYAYEILDTWLRKMIENDQKLPINFDYPFFFRGIKLILDGDHAVSISKALWLLTNCYPLLQITQKREILKLIFSNMFFKLFMHWSLNVRCIFHNFILYRVNHLHRQHKASNKLDSLKKDFLLIIQKNQIENKEEKSIIINELIYADYSRMIAILEEANKRLTAQLKKNDLLMNINKQAKSLKMKYLHKRNQMKKKMIRDKMKQSLDQENGLNNSVMDSLDLSIITRKESVHSLASIGRQETNFSAFDLMKSNQNDEKSRNEEEHEDNEVQRSSIESISNLESILSGLNNMSEDENKKNKKIGQKQKNNRRASLTELPQQTQETDVNLLNVEKYDLFPNQRKETTISRSNKRDLEKMLSNEMKQKQKNLLKKQVQKPSTKTKKGIKVYRRYRDQDEAHEKLRIPKEYLKYLPESWEEFDQSKKEYTEWLQNWYKELYSNEDHSEEEVIQKVLQLYVPEIQVKIPKDESEGQGSFSLREDNEW